MQTQTSSQNLVYFKRKNNACYTVNIKPGISFDNLLTIFARKESISSKNLLLIHKGKKVQDTGFLLKLGSKSIVHLVNLQEVNSERICITLKDIRNNLTTKITNSDLKVRDFIKQHIAKIDGTPYFQIGLFHLGKILHPEKTFAEQLVQNNSEVLVINLSDHLKSKKLGTETKKTQNQEEIKNLELKNIISNNQQKNAAQALRQSPIFINQNVQNYEKKSDNKQQKQEQENNLLTFFFQPTPSSNLILKKDGQNVQKESEKKDAEELEGNPKAIKQDVQEQRTEAKQQIPNVEYTTSKKTRFLKKQTQQSKEGDRILQQLNQISQLPEITYDNFKIKISQVQSDKSDDQDYNKVHFNVQDQNGIENSQSKKIQVHQAQVQSKPKEKLAERGILPGDLIYTGAEHQSQTVSFIDNLLKQYKGMFE